ncbi:MAG: amidohydrolase [Alistipes sp.]|jgi:5-methylthioadenosine/S-adenosylhomocysteine deaminase|nr:amidohydrolase [Alistipes sp.]
MRSDKIIVSGATILPMTEPECSGSASDGGAKDGDAQKYFTGSVALEGGRIAIVARDGCAEGEQRLAEFRVKGDFREIDGRGRLLMPGLVNTHTHVAMTLMRNLADDIELMEWLHERVWPFESRLGAEEIAWGAKLGIAEMLLGGTTTFVDMYWHEAAIARVARDMGIRAVLCPSFLDGERMAEFERDLPETIAVADGCDRLSVRIAPHAPYTCSEENLRRAIGLAKKYGVGAHTHISETLDEQRIVRERYGCTPTEHLRNVGLFELPTIAAHCVHVTGGDMDILREFGVTAVHNPQSNMKIASGAAPVAAMLSRGVNLAIGTDGACSNNDLDMWDEMRTASFLAKHTAADPASMPAYEILKMATVGGARAIGRDGELGVVAEGALADLIMLDLEKPHLCPRHDLVAALVYSAKSTDVERVFVAGRPVVENDRVIGLDLPELMAEVEATVGRVKQAI